MRVGEREELVAVARGALDRLDGDEAARAGAVLDDHLASPARGELLGDEAHEDRGRHTARVRHGDLHRPGRKSLRGCQGRAGGEGKTKCKSGEQATVK